MYTNFNEFKQIVENKTTEPRMMSFVIPEEKTWIKNGDNNSIEYLGRVYNILPKDLDFFKTNTYKTIQFKYLIGVNNIMFPKLQKTHNENTLNILDKDTLEPIDSEIYEIDYIVDIITDQEEIKKLESSNQNYKTDHLTYKSVGRNDIIWITCMLKPRNNSTAYPLGELGIVKCKVLETFYGLSKLKQLKNGDKIL